MKKIFTLILSVFLFYTILELKAQTQSIAVEGAVVGGGVGRDMGNSVVTDKAGNIYVAGTFQNSATFGTASLISDGGSDIFIAKYTSAGDLAWIVQGAGTRNDVATGITIDSKGNLYVCGYFNSSSLDFDGLVIPNTNPATFDLFLMRISPTGGVVWARNSGGTKNDVAYGLTIDKFDRLYLTGSFEETAKLDTTTVNAQGGIDAFVSRWNLNGNCIWAEQAGGEADDYGRSVTTDQDGNVYATGGFASEMSIFAFLTLINTDDKGTQDIFIAAYDSVAAPLWVQSAGGPNNDVSNAIYYDTLTNKIFLAGGFTNAATFGSANLLNSFITGTAAFLSRLDRNGNFEWTRHTNGVFAIANDLVLDTLKQISVTGLFSGSIAWNDGCSATHDMGTDPRNLQTDIFVARYSSNTGSFLGTMSLGSADLPDAGNALAVHKPTNRIYLTGYFSDTIPYGTNLKMSSSGEEDFFLARLKSAPSSCGVPAEKGRIIANIEPACLFSDDSLVVGGYTGQVQYWETSTDKGRTWNRINNTTKYQLVGSLSVDSTYFRATIKNCTCPEIKTDSVLVVQDFPTKGGTTVGGDTVCVLSNSGTIRLQGHYGKVIHWESSNDNFRTFNTLQVTTPFFAYNNLKRDTWLRALVRNGTCGDDYSTVAFIKVDSCQACGIAPTFGGQAVATQDTICITANSGFIRVENHIGKVQYWEVSTNDFATVNRIITDSTRIPFRNIRTRTCYRALVMNFTCQKEFTSSPVCLTIDSCQYCGFIPPKGGAIEGPDTVCVFSNRQTLKLKNYVGEVSRWEFSYNNFEVGFPIFEDIDSIETRNLFQSVWYRAVVSGEKCRPVYSDTHFIFVKTCQLCRAPQTPKLLFASDKQAYLRWSAVPGAVRYEAQWRPVGSNQWVNLPSVTNTSYTLSDLTFNTNYQFRVRTVCKDGFSAYSAPETFSTSCSSGGFATANGSSTVCLGQNSGSLNLINSVGNVLWWEYSTDDWKTISQTEQASVRYNYANLERTTAFRAYVKNGNCSGVYSEPVTLTVEDCGSRCPEPSNLRAENITITGASISWDGDTDYKFELSYKAVGAVTWQIISNIAIPPFELGGLYPNTRYEIRLRSICPVQRYSVYSEALLITTKPETSPCVPPFNVSTTARITEADLSWVGVTGAMAYQVRYKPIGTQIWSIQNTVLPRTRLLNLEPGRAYEVEIRTNCGMIFSSWGARAQFITLPYPCEVPSNVAVTVLNSSTADLRWNSTAHATQYEIRYVLMGSIDTQRVTSTVNNFRLTGLRPASVYGVSIRANCPPNTVTAYSTNVVFATPNSRLNDISRVELANISLYPNPNNGQFKLNFDNLKEQELKIDITSLTGQSVYQQKVKFDIGKHELVFELSDVATGVYLLNISGKESLKTLKLIIE